ncbi:uncharacterized protein LOC141808843 isoform X2 [Halichoeres trimaculatus]|uniref:uncharacterized protein LOC141808843 isoform X2 n=1 Tax=Halichoeres trimaculatus TaxID=147232 RepID=UPI003D9DF254
MSSFKVRNMKIFLGALMVFFVTGEDSITIEGFLNESVHLPCNCSGRDLREEFRWQKGKGDNAQVLFSYNSIYNIREKFKGKVHLSAPEGGANCDFFLTNITAGDQETYVCSFKRSGGYTYRSVDLKVYARYNRCVKNVSAKVFQCDVNGRYRDAEIWWKMDGKRLKNSTTDNIAHYYSWDNSTGLHHFHSKFITNRSLTATPSCHVQAKYEFKISETCEPETSPSQEIPQHSWRYLTIIPVTLVLGIFVYLCYRFRLSRRKGQRQFCIETQKMKVTA